MVAAVSPSSLPPTIGASSSPTLCPGHGVCVDCVCVALVQAGIKLRAFLLQASQVVGSHHEPRWQVWALTFLETIAIGRTPERGYVLV